MILYIGHGKQLDWFTFFSPTSLSFSISYGEGKLVDASQGFLSVLGYEQLSQLAGRLLSCFLLM